VIEPEREINKTKISRDKGRAVCDGIYKRKRRMTERVVDGFHVW
jgi:hypothetical protein